MKILTPRKDQDIGSLQVSVVNETVSSHRPPEGLTLNTD